MQVQVNYSHSGQFVSTLFSLRQSQEPLSVRLQEAATENTFMLRNRRPVEMDLPLKKEGLNIITEADGFIAGNLAFNFNEKRFTNTSAVAGRCLDNPFIKNVLEWGLEAPFDKGLACTCRWISPKYPTRKVGQRIGIG